jgi:hypothetical protein
VIPATSPEAAGQARAGDFGQPSGSIFLLSQFFQTAQHDSPLCSGLRILAWTIAPSSAGRRGRAV